MSEATVGRAACAGRAVVWRAVACLTVACLAAACASPRAPAPTVPARGEVSAPCPVAYLPAYAHNDYRNARPLTDALALGYRGVEVDLYLIDGALRVGHDRREAARSPSFDSLYLQPLRAAMERCPALRALEPRLLLTVELKEESPAALAALRALLDRDVLPLDVVLVGWHPPLSDWTASDPLFGVQHLLTRAGEVPDGSLDPRVRLFSLDYGKTMGRWWRTRAGRARWLATLRAVSTAFPDRLVRVYNVPEDAGVYAELLENGADLIGTKSLERTSRLLSPR